MPLWAHSGEVVSASAASNNTSQSRLEEFIVFVFIGRGSFVERLADTKTGRDTASGAMITAAAALMAH